MSKIFLSLILIVLACNDAGKSNVEKTTDSIPEDTVKKPAEVVRDLSPDTTYPLGLTTYEMVDDSVFDDGSRPTAWYVADIDDPLAFKLFLKRLKYWVRNDQRDSVAAVVAYPMRHPKIRNKKEFLANYDRYFNELVKSSLEKQNLRQIFRRDLGAMTGNGNLWFTENENGFRIIGINN